MSCDICAHSHRRCSTRGTVLIWDALTLEHLRTIQTPAPKPLHGMPWDRVEHIIVDNDRDILIVSVGSRILYWKAGKVVDKRKGKSKNNGPMRPADARYQRAFLQSSPFAVVYAYVLPSQTN